MEPCVGGSVHPARDRFCIQLYFVVFERSGAHSPSRRDDGFVFSQALFRRLPQWRLLVVIQHVLRKSQVGGWPVPAAPGIPLRSRSARPRPHYAGAKGDGVGACLRKWWKLGALPHPRPGHTPRARFACTRPFRWSERGRVFALALPFWMDVPSAEAPACAGMTRWGGNDGGGDGGDGPSPPRASPCVLAPLARVPLTLKRRGTVGFLAAVLDSSLRGNDVGRPGPPRPRPGHTPRASLRSLAPLSLGAKGAGCFPSPWGLPMEGMSHGMCLWMGWGYGFLIMIFGGLGLGAWLGGLGVCRRGR